MNRYIEPARLLNLVASNPVRGAAPPEEVIMREPTVLIPVSDPGMPPLDLTTFEIRLQRWRDGDGPVLHGMEQFVAALRDCTAPTRAITVYGARTNYTFLLDEGLSRVVAGIAVDVPASGEI